MSIVFEAEDGEWFALTCWGSAVQYLHPREAFEAEMQLDPDKVFDLVM